MKPLLIEVRHNPMLRLLAFVPVVFVVEAREPGAGTLLFVLPCSRSFRSQPC
jgi:Ca2+:H+ antiporter